MGGYKYMRQIKRKVVIADDEQRSCKLLESLIDWEQRNMEIAGVARDGFEALRMCEKIRPDFLITDIRMPGLSGLELIQRIHQLIPSVKVIIITGYSQFEYAHQALRFGVIDYLLKPIKKEELLAALEKGEDTIHQTEAQKTGRETVTLKSMQNFKGNLLAAIIREQSCMNKREFRKTILDEYHVSFSEEYWQMMQIEIILNGEENTLSVQDYLERKMKDIVLEELGRENVEIVTAAENGNIFILLNGSRDALDHIKKKFPELRSDLLFVNELFRKIIFTIGISSVIHDFDQIDQCVEECRTCLSYKIVAGKNKIIRYSEIPVGKFQTDFFVDEAFKKIFMESIANADIQGITEKLEELNVKVYQYSKHLDGQIVFEIYQSVVRLFFSGIQIFNLQDYGEYSQDNILLQIDYMYSISAAFGYLSDAFACLLRQCREETEKQSTRPIRMAKLYISEHYREQITLESVAGFIGLNETYLSTVFKKQVGKSLVDYLTSIRIQHAKELLVDDKKSIGEIACEVGFNDAKYFTKRFKKYTGVSPNEYRKLFG